MSLTDPRPPPPSGSIPIVGRRSADTTEEQDRKTAAQRRVNILWEVTQSVVALSVTFATLFVAVQLTLRVGATESAFILLSNAFFLIVGFYFGRTNHQRTGGVGGSDASGSR